MMSDTETHNPYIELFRCMMRLDARCPECNRPIRTREAQRRGPLATFLRKVAKYDYSGMFWWRPKER